MIFFTFVENWCQRMKPFLPSSVPNLFKCFLFFFTDNFYQKTWKMISWFRKSTDLERKDAPVVDCKLGLNSFLMKEFKILVFPTPFLKKYWERVWEIKKKTWVSDHYNLQQNFIHHVFDFDFFNIIWWRNIIF